MLFILQLKVPPCILLFALDSDQGGKKVIVDVNFIKMSQKACWTCYCWAECAAPDRKLCLFATYDCTEIDLHKSNPSTSGGRLRGF